MNRDALNAELNIKLARAAELRGTDATDELIAVSAEIRSITDELAVIASREVIVPVAAPEAPKSLGTRAAEVLAGKPLGTRAVIALPFGGGDTVTQPSLVGGIAEKPYVAPKFIDMIATNPTSSDAVNYIREIGFDNQAAARLAGVAFAESDLTFDQVTEPIANVGHLVRAAEETLADQSALAGLLDRRGASGVRSKIGTQLLSAANTTNGVKSVWAAATSVDVTLTTPADVIDGILTAKTNRELAGFEPTIVTMTPTQFEAIQLAKNAVTGAYVAAGPFSGAYSTIWGLTVVTDANAQGVMVSDMNYCSLAVRSDGEVASDRDLASGMVAVRVQARLQLINERPEAHAKLV